jgi:thiamine biosynthesis lipoprotein
MTTALAIGTVDGQARHMAVEAMATRFDLVYWGPRAAGDEALAEIVRLDERLSAYKASSDVGWINAHAGLRAVKVEPRTFTLLQRCIEVSEETDGAFDITVGPLMQAWRFICDTGALPAADRMADARDRVGYRYLHLDPTTSTIRFGRAGMRLDLGAAGRGYAMDAAIAVLRSHGVQSALLHGGSNSVHSIGESANGPWTIRVTGDGREGKSLCVRDSAVSVSSADHKAFTAGGQRYGHVFDPLLGLPAGDTRAAVVTGPCSLECDALSTALFVLGRDWLPEMRRRFPGYDGDVSSQD